MHAHVLHTFAYVSAASAASPAPTQPSMKETALRAASTKGDGRRRRPPPFVEAARSKRAKHEQACTLYGQRLHPTKIMDLRNLQGVQTMLFRGGAGGMACGWAVMNIGGPS